MDVDLDSLENHKEHKFTISDYFRKALNNNAYLKHFEDAIEYTLLKNMVLHIRLKMMYLNNTLNIQERMF